MQHAYATSNKALNLMAGAQIVMGAARANDSSLPQEGSPTQMSLGAQRAMDVLVAPRDCEINIGANSFTVKLAPQNNASIQDVVASALEATASGPSSGPSSDLGMGRKK